MPFKKGQSGNPKGAPKGLTAMQRRFIAEYLIDMNATQAAKRAGYKQPKVHGHDVLNKPEVRALVDAGLAKRAAICGVTAERVLQEIARIAFSDPATLFDGKGKLKGIHEMTSDQTAVISSLEVVKGNIDHGDGKRDILHKVKFWDKVKALDLAMQHLGLTKGNVAPLGEIILRWAGGD